MRDDYDDFISDEDFMRPPKLKKCKVTEVKGKKKLSPYDKYKDQMILRTRLDKQCSPPPTQDSILNTQDDPLYHPGDPESGFRPLKRLANKDKSKK